METKNIDIETSLSPEDVVSRIGLNTKKISTCFGFAIATSFSKESQLVGEVNLNSIKLARARLLSNSSSKPVLTAVIEKTPMGSVLKGKFEVNCFKKYFFWFSSALFACVEILILISIFSPENTPIFSVRNILVALILPSFQLAAYVYGKMSTDRTFVKDVQWIENELRRLLT